MKISTDNNAVLERDGVSSDGAFTIQFNAKMAKILSDGLYSDKIQSIIRELSCNAVDSHVESGQPDRPIEVHLPSMFEPWFHVRDFGTGLDHDQVTKVYTSYGESTKTNSNEFIGQLGLGSKSPFSYVDAYDVTAIKDGVERQYSMYKNEQGMPSCALLGTRVTSEPNGVTVKMPVKQSDITRFSEKAAKVFRWFNVRPTITGAKGLEINEQPIAFCGNGWRIHKRAGYYHSDMDRPVALMGKVAYPIDSNSINMLTSAHGAILSIPLVLEFPIGDLEIAASREALGYDARTQANLRKMLDRVLTELTANFELDMAAATTEWDARKLFGDIFGSESGFRYEFERAYGTRGLAWNGQMIKDPHVSFKTADLWDPAVSNPKIYNNSGRYKRARQITYHGSVTIRCSDDSIIVFDDLERGGMSRINYLIETGSSKQSIFFFEQSDLKTKDEIVTMLGNPPYKLTSQLPKRPSSARSTRINMLEYTGHENNRKAWKAVDVTLEEGGIYVLLDRWDIRRDSTVVDNNNFDAVVDLACTVGILSSDDKIYAPRGNFKSKITEDAGWVNAWSLIEEGINKKLTPSILQTVADSSQYSHATSLHAMCHDPQLWTTQWKLEDQHSPFARLISSMRQLAATTANATRDRAIIDLAQRFGATITAPKPTVEIAPIHNEVKKTYPMLEFVFADRYGRRGIGNREAVMIIQDYVNQIDRIRKSDGPGVDDLMKTVIAA